MIDGEMMLLNMEAGNYYSLSGTGAPLWSCIRSGAEEAALLKSLQEAFPRTEVSQLTTDLNAFLETLKAEALVVDCDITTPPAPKFEGDYAAPKVEKYTDLQDLLLIDPIHEADETGWPATAS